MSNIIRALLAMLLCLVGMSAHADEYIAKPGDGVERVAKATGTTPAEFINANRGKLKAPLYWMYIGETYNTPLPPAKANTMAKKDVFLTLSRTQLDAREAKAQAKLHNSSEAAAIVQKQIADIPASRAQSAHVTVTAQTAAKQERKSAKQKLVVRSTQVATSVADEVPNFDEPCTGCSLETFLAKTDFPADVQSTLSNKVAKDDFIETTVSSGEQFELMQFAGGTTWQFVTASWRDQHSAYAREYVVRAHGMVYTMVYFGERGNWSIRTSSPDPHLLLAIKQELDNIVRPKCASEKLTESECDVMPLVALIWRTKYRSHATIAVRENSVYADLSNFINNFTLPGVQEDHQASTTFLSLNLN